MISLYSGTPGAGKSLHLASRLLNWMKYKNAPIIGNFQTDFSCIQNPKGHYLYIDNSDLTVDRLINFSKNYSEYVGRRVKEGEILLVIDECQIMFNARDWGQKTALHGVHFSPSTGNWVMKLFLSRSLTGCLTVRSAL